MFERGIGNGNDQFVGRLAIRFNNDGAVLAFGRVEQRPHPFERDFLVAKINRRDRATSDADDLLILLRAEEERGSWGRNSNARLENKVRAQEQEKDEKKHYVDERKDDEPAEIIFFCPAELHPRSMSI